MHSLSTLWNSLPFSCIASFGWRSSFIAVTYFPFICDEEEDDAVCVTQICKCRNPSAMFLFGFYLPTWSCWREKSTSYSACCYRSPLPGKSTECIRTLFSTFIALTHLYVCVCVCGTPTETNMHAPSHRDEYFNRHVVLPSRKSLLIPPTMSDILRQLYGLNQRSTCTCIQ